MGIHQLVLTKHHFKRLRRIKLLTETRALRGLSPGDEQQLIDSELITHEYARTFFPWNPIHRLRTVLTEKGRAIVTEKPENA